MTKFILLASRRSGTSLVIDCLNSHPQVHCEKRAFGLEKKIANPTQDEHSGGFFLHRTKSVSNRIKYYFNRAGLIEKFLDNDVFNEHKAKQAVGFRLIYEMSEKYPMVATWAANNDVKVVHLIRENILKTYVSNVSARVHKMRHPRKGEEIKTVKIHLDPDDTVAELNKRLSLIEQQRFLFKNCPSLELSYENFVSNRVKESSSLLNFLEVDNTFTLESDLVKINPDTLADVIDNYDDIKARLKGTVLEKYLY